MLSSSADPLETAYDLVMLDLDGVVYIGPDAVPGAPEHLARARSTGLRCAFVTNNASRPPSAVVRHLTEIGVEADEADVVTSAQAAATVLRREHGDGARVVVLGGEGLWQAVRDEGLEVVDVDDDDLGRPAALVTGYGPEVVWRQVMRTAVLVRDGLPWVASNTDLTIPTSYGVAPGHGVLVETLRRFAEVEPTVAGKPARPLLDETVARVGGSRPLMVGDRVDTDIDGGINAGVDTLLVMTGITTVRELAQIAAASRPTYVAADLGGLHTAHETPAPPSEGESTHQGWTARVAGDRLEVTGDGATNGWWQLVAVAAWDHLDRTGNVVATDTLDPPEPERP